MGIKKLNNLSLRGAVSVGKKRKYEPWVIITEGSERKNTSHKCELVGWGKFKGFEFPVSMALENNTLELKVGGSFHEKIENGHVRLLPVTLNSSPEDIWSEVIEQLEHEVDSIVAFTTPESSSKFGTAWRDSYHTGDCVFDLGMVNIEVECQPAQTNSFYGDGYNMGTTKLK